MERFTVKGIEYMRNGAQIAAHGATYICDQIELLTLDCYWSDYDNSDAVKAEGIDEILSEAGAIVLDCDDEWTTPEALAEAELDAAYSADDLRERNADYYASR